MKRLIILLVLALVAWQGYGGYKSGAKTIEPPSVVETALPQRQSASPLEAPSASQFKCDGRTHCSQMTSCAEATFFLRNCPGVKMDGNNDGIPCEKQWCNN